MNDPALIKAEHFPELFARETSWLDLRAPAEFARGAIPGASNMPLLDDEQRHRVGTAFKQQGADVAVRLGYRLLSGDTRRKRMRAWREWALANPRGVIYCWRGGQRSSIVSAWLAADGIKRRKVEGGYKALRTWLINRIDQAAKQLPIHASFLVGGRTGSGKTRLLDSLAKQRSGVIDLEGLANHRGSAFGHMAKPQPTQINFEHELALQLHQILTLSETETETETETEHTSNHDRTTLVMEDESRTIGRRAIPEAWFQLMQRSGIAQIEASLEDRIRCIVEDYILDGLADHRASFRPSELASDAAEANVVLPLSRAEMPDGGFSNWAQSLCLAMDKLQKKLGGADHRIARNHLDQAISGHARWAGSFDAKPTTSWASDKAIHKAMELHEPWIRFLLERYYDPMYEWQLQRKADRLQFSGSTAEVMEWLLEPEQCQRTS